MSRSVVRRSAISAAIALLGSAIGAASMAQEAFQPVGSDVSLDQPFVQRGNDTQPTTVMVMLSGDSVVKMEKRFGRRLERSERESVASARRAEQDTVRPHIERLGGKVLARLQHALNGIKVQIPRNRINSLRHLPGVVDVKAVGNYNRLNTNEVQLIGAPQAWQSTLGAFQGQGVKIAILDTGIDYTHANFGGPGTVAAYNAAAATSTAPPSPLLVGPSAPKVKGGIDLVGDAYTGSNTPVPDANPLDCSVTAGFSGHGSHVAGTATGLGVLTSGATYSGPYTASAYSTNSFRIGPGVAPKADLYVARVFGCSGSTNVVAEAIDWAVAQGVDVISMSLGADFGNVGNGDGGSLAEAQAVADATAAGIVVVAASGNSGSTPYITSAPGVYEGAISVAATDALPGVPTASLALAGGASVNVLNANGGAYASGTTFPVRVLRNADGTVSLGCDPNEYDPAVTGVSLAGKVVVTQRGSCARVFRAGAAQHFGAAAAAMINNAAGLPPYEGPIPGGATSPTSGNIYEPVTIPFFGIALADGATISGPTGGPAAATAQATNTGISPNAGFEKIASFSSQGPRIGDSAMRPSVTAPGVSVVSTASGTGNGFQILSGTSMATPAVAGVAVLAKQAHPGWSQPDLRAAIVQTASPSMMKDLAQRAEGGGLVQAQAAVATQAVVRMPDESISFGFQDLLSDFSGTKTVTVHNAATKAVQFNIAAVKTTGPAAATVSAPGYVIVNANSDATFPVRLDVPAASVGGGTGFQDVGGYLQLTPSNSRLNANVKLSVPFYMVAHSRSNMAVSASGGTLTYGNAGGAISSQPVPFVLGQYQPTPLGVQQLDVRAVGVRSSGTNLIFGLNTHNRMSTTLANQEVDICIDTSGGPGFTPNKILIGLNGSRFSSSLAKSTYATAVFPTDANCNINGSGTILFTVTQPTDNSTLQLPVTLAALGLSSASPRIKYVVNYYGTDGSGAQMPGVGSYNAFTPAVTFGASPVVAPNGTGTSSFAVNAEIANTPALGVMLLLRDNVPGAAQAALLPLQ
ncbi:S8 family peptidase [Roseateles saccharophilus]|uniref:PA domain-containing protein n=1 Tax=Roseateles saccharophilus TaxID=304 RepID=A0A4R3URK6_ROSSA|nr:S8 family serine peptidase [Roseateles saccharophilus]MDG0834700.1 peptidase S8 and S53 subtilisin kexin sedolisin [Roseateles saccharophilus]TCU92644.1 PA domain-containing protein [Roseateles saccharophilus]